jgi:hypothetical protein
MSEYQNLEKFNLAEHGDAIEHRWAASVLGIFPRYEEFWKKYVVPLTNRVRPDVPRENENWLRFRSDAPQRLERMAMYHYSVFYYLARGLDEMNAQNLEYPEDAFTLLSACGENVLRFCRQISKIAKDFGKTKFLPNQPPDLCLDTDPQGCFVEVENYRDTLLHYPVLGRRVAGSRLYLPKRECLDDVKESWRAVAANFVPHRSPPPHETTFHITNSSGASALSLLLCLLAEIISPDFHSRFSLPTRPPSPTVIPFSGSAFLPCHTLSAHLHPALFHHAIPIAPASAATTGGFVQTALSNARGDPCSHQSPKMRFR